MKVASPIAGVHTGDYSRRNRRL